MSPRGLWAVPSLQIQGEEGVAEDSVHEHDLSEISPWNVELDGCGIVVCVAWI